MRLLFAMRHPGYLRNYESTIAELSARGHDITIDFAQRRKRGLASPYERMAASIPRLEMSERGLLNRVKDPWSPVGDALRLAIDVSRYADPRYDDAELLRARLVSKFAAVPVPSNERLSRSILRMRRPLVRNHFQRAMERLDAALPLNERLIDALETFDPDALIVTPVVDAGSRQVDVIRHAQALGIPVGVAVASWDNLSNKGLLRCQPDRLFVWNEAQKLEAVEMHGVDPDSVAITGAQLFDHWFDWRPTRTREEFAHRGGLDPGEPFVVWMSSSPFIGGQREVDYVTRWLERLRARPGGLSRLGVLIRPHPQVTAPWSALDPSEFGNVVIFPELGANPIDSASRQDFFESIYFSEGVIGVNSSAMIESAIVGKPVFTVTAEEFAGVQGGTLHFSHLEDALLHRAATDDDLFSILEASLADPAAFASRNRTFLESFIRPLGLDVSATSELANAIEDLARRPRNAPTYGSGGDAARRMILRTTKAAMEVESRRRTTRRAEAAGWPPTVTIRPRRGREKAEATMEQNRKTLLERAVTSNLEKAPRVELTDQEAQLPLMRMVAEPAQLDNDLHVQFKRISKGEGPIVLGPWTSELGFELLYWVPYLRWIFANYDIDPARAVSVSRGGAGVFYGDVANRHIEIFDLMDHSAYRAGLQRRWEERGGQKQAMWTELDTDLVADLESRLGTDGYEVIHPSAMYRLFYYWWRDRMPMASVRDRMVFRPFAVPELPAALVDRLPAEFSTVRFYFRPSFPDTVANRAFIEDLLTRLSAERPVVLLSTGLRFDDHEEHTFGDPSRFIQVDDVMTPSNNLAVQAAVIARSTSLYGTYGGLTYLAPYFRVPAYSFYSEPEHLIDAHGTLAAYQKRSLGVEGLILDSKTPLWSLR